MDVEAIVLVGCFAPMVAFLGAIMWCQFRYEARNDTRRYPRYGKHDDMRDDKFKIKSRYDDKQT